MSRASQGSIREEVTFRYVVVHWKEMWGSPSPRTKLHASVMIRKALKSGPEALGLAMEKQSKL